MRLFVTVTAALALGLAATPPATAQSTLNFASYGGAYQAAQRKALLDPIEKLMNITVKEDTLTGVADVRAQVLANAVKWDVADLGGASCARGEAEGLFEPLDYSVIKTDGIDKSMIIRTGSASSTIPPSSPGTPRNSVRTAPSPGPTSGTPRNSPARVPCPAAPAKRLRSR